MTEQKWKTDPKLHSCGMIKKGNQYNKALNYKEVYIDEFLESDPIKDWESIDRCINLWKWALDKSEITDISKFQVLDCGTKDGQFPEYLKDKVKLGIGIEISN